MRALRQGPISTHALREEGDVGDAALGGPELISTHALREEGDHPGAHGAMVLDQFLPTPSARRATVHTMNCNHRCYISTHALREEGDL